MSGDQLRAYLEKYNRSLAPGNNDGVNTDWFKEVTRSGFSHNHNISFGGNNKKTNYDASVNYLNNEGIMKGSALNRIILRGNLEQLAFNDRLKIGVSVSNSISNQENIPQLVFQNMYTYLPTVNIKNADGTYKEDFSRTRNYLNPVSLIYNNLDHLKTKLMLGSARAELKIVDGLRYTLSMSMQDEQLNRNIYNNRYSGLAQNTNGLAVRNAYTNTKKILETFLNYDRTFGQHDLKLLAGYSWQEDRNGDGFQASARGFVTDGITYNNMGLSDPPAGFLPDYGNTNIKTLRFISFYGRASYSYADKYIVSASLRRDGSSAFGANNRWGLFPALSGAWRVKQENFLKNVSWLDDAKVRVGYGITGNARGFDPLIAVLRYGTEGRFFYDNRYINAISPLQNDNPNLKWERTDMLNAGVDLSFLNGRLNVAVDYYVKNTADLIWTYAVPSTMYLVDVLTANVGKISNKGIELQLDAVPVAANGFTWRTSLNLAHNKNTVESLSNSTFAIDSIPSAYLGGKGNGNPSQQVREGKPLGAIYVAQYAGKDANGKSQFVKKDGTLSIAVPLASDYVYAGNAQPKLIFGWNNAFSYRSFDLNFFFRGVTGNKILNGTLANLNSPNDGENINIPVFSLTEDYGDANAHVLSTRYVENGAYLRMDNATIGYKVPVHNNYIKGLRIYASANNVFVVTKYRGIDPEINMGGLEPGVDNNNFYPKTRSFLLGVNVNF
ncbi:SusC/RagA family TonB-linked outer membrane protein [Chitinophaga sedimenti]|uniref:SusC/RagA family TonB-linked outer membrane protein n=1 Tax=Chitinophaga sedimenti TaxID=2033606 RepID=UPI002005FE79|nr:SusC/RagA family TonB-linked outer membrane protein [Chitinophaga sedimenti]MCK7558336.1 SusC/RagA family TonB-linked outer membrane protein [Chitinophaga sedimenti]